jgi:hypothetical protein
LPEVVERREWGISAYGYTVSYLDENVLKLKGWDVAQ